MVWQQIYDPMGNMWISTLLAAIPVVVMLVGLGFLHLKAHIAAGAGLVAALLISVFVYNMPAEMAAELKLSPTTFRRRLEREGCAFQGIKDDVRRGIAQQKLRETDSTATPRPASLSLLPVLREVPLPSS